MSDPTKLGKLFDINLKDYVITKVYILELDKPFSRVFPVVYSSDRSAVVFLDKSLLEELKPLLPKRKSKITFFYMLYHAETNTGFNLTLIDGNNLPIRVLTREAFEELKSVPNSFEWSY